MDSRSYSMDSRSYSMDSSSYSMDSSSYSKGATMDSSSYSKGATVDTGSYSKGATMSASSHTVDARASNSRSYAMASMDGRSCTVDGAVGRPAVAVGLVGGDGGCETRREKEQLDHVVDCHPVV